MLNTFFRMIWYDQCRKTAVADPPENASILRYSQPMSECNLCLFIVFDYFLYN